MSTLQLAPMNFMKPDSQHPPAQPPTTKAKIWGYPVMGVLPRVFSLGGP